MYTLSDVAIIALDSMMGLEYKYKSEILQLVDDPKELLSCDDKLLAKIGNIVGDKVNKLKLCFQKQYYDSVIEGLDKFGIKAITYLSFDYPKLLKNIPAYPLILYAKGNIKLLKERCFGIVGSRKTLPYALKFAENIAKDLTDLGVTVVTGSAIGGDRSALIGALPSGKVISVLANGHKTVYPESNRDLIEKVEKAGLVISEYPPDMPARVWTFPVRNRIIAGLSEGSLIISGELSSGARHTANYATEYGRDVFAIPYSIGIKSGELCNDLIKNGAYLCDSVDDIIGVLNLKPKEEKAQIKLVGMEKTVFEAIKNGFDSSVTLMQECNIKIFQLAPIISSLEIKGLIVKLVGNKYKAIK